MNDSYNTFPLVVFDEYGKMYFEPYKRWEDPNKITDLELWSYHAIQNLTDSQENK